MCDLFGAFWDDFKSDLCSTYLVNPVFFVKIALVLDSVDADSWKLCSYDMGIYGKLQGHMDGLRLHFSFRLNNNFRCEQPDREGHCWTRTSFPESPAAS